MNISFCDEDALRNLYLDFNIQDAQEIKMIERTTNHDVKAVEYYIKSKFQELGLEPYKEFIHFGLTSQDINNTAQPLMLKEALVTDVYEELEELLERLTALANNWKEIPMLARTHGQPASPTSLGKELYVFVYRLREQLQQLYSIPHSAKFGGATGNMNAHYVAYPNLDWKFFAQMFTSNQLGLSLENYTTQISNYDNFSALFDALKRISTILIDLCRDIWQYISLGYFKQKVVEGEVGSSAMPHKVNPIDFENAEGNCGLSIAIFSHLSQKLPISRLQRDLTDSTVLRNMGVPIAHLSVAIRSLMKGLNKLMLNEELIKQDLQNSWAVVAEAIQTILRRESYPKPYEALKSLTRGRDNIDQEVLTEFIDSLDISDDVKEEMKSITPFNYIGNSIKF